MKKQTFLGIIIGCVIFGIIITCYINFRTSFVEEYYGFDKDKYQHTFSRREKSTVTCDYNNITGNDMVDAWNNKITLTSAQINSKQIKLTLDIDYAENIDGNTIQFAYYIYDNNKNLIVNDIYSNDCENILPYFYKENQEQIGMSMEEYVRYLGNTYKILGTRWDKKICDVENRKISFTIDKRQNQDFPKFDTLYLVIYEINYDGKFTYDPNDDTKFDIENVTLDNRDYEFEIKNINF